MEKWKKRCALASHTPPLLRNPRAKLGGDAPGNGEEAGVVLLDLLPGERRATRIWSRGSDRLRLSMGDPTPKH